MHLTALLTLLLASAVHPTPLPFPVPVPDPLNFNRREIGGVSHTHHHHHHYMWLMTDCLTDGQVLICNGANAQGHCEYAVYPLETCHDLPPTLVNNAATFAPDGDGFYCYPYL